jgi:hypothetical protein
MNIQNATIMLVDEAMCLIMCWLACTKLIDSKLGPSSSGVVDKTEDRIV